jgi:hypothetical protein
MNAYTESVITYIDILGFRNFVNTEPDAETIRKSIDAILHTTKLPAESESNFGKRSSHFSDTAVRTSPLRASDGKSHNYGILFHEVLSVVFVQLYLFSRSSRFIRGVITIGDIFHDHDILFGPGLIQAYDFEREWVKIPAVVVENARIERYRVAPTLWAWDNDFDDDAEYVSRLVCYNETAELRFVDYLRACETELDEPDAYPAVLGYHRDAIVQMYEAAEGDAGITSKADRLADYHNFTLRDIDAENWPGDDDLFLQVRPNRAESNFSKIPL